MDALADEGPLLSEPYTRQLDGKLRELRFHLDRQSVRITYWIASGRRIVLLTVFVKTRMRETQEVERAKRALARCIEQEHTVEEER
jgi:phage-related protein